MGAIKHDMDAVAANLGIDNPNDPRVIEEVRKMLAPAHQRRTWPQPDFEERVSDLADALALKQTGNEFSTLPAAEQYKVWLEAERQVNDQIAESNEHRREMALDRKMGL